MHRAIVLLLPLVLLPLKTPDLPDAAKVEALVKQHAGGDEAKKLAAEAALLRFGPDVLPLLPRDVKEPRLQAVADLLTEIKARPVTVARGTTVADALALIEKQTGVKLRDARTDKKLAKTKTDLDKKPFWEAVDALAGDLGAGLSLYGRDGFMELVDRTSKNPPASYHHAFRTTVKRIDLRKDFAGGSADCIIHLATTWEPRLLPLLWEVGPASVQFAPDGGGRKLKAEQVALGRSEVEGKSALEFQVQVPAPARSSPAIDVLQGSVGFVLPTKMLDFNFPNLKPAPPMDGVQVTLKTPMVQPDRWKIKVVIDNPPGTPHFDSSHDWLVHNRIWLSDGKHKWQPVRDWVDARSGQQAVLEYDFLLKNNPVPNKSKPADWTLHYRTPGRMIEVQVPYRFEKLPLP